MQEQLEKNNDRQFKREVVNALPGILKDLAEIAERKGLIEVVE
jgi:hypothetical protein